MFNIEIPIFAFSHCRDVVVEVSKAGGLGVFGMARENPRKLHESLDWIDRNIQGKPYGIDILMPTKYHSGPKAHDELTLPKRHVEFIKKILDDAGVPSISEAEAEQAAKENLESVNMTREDSMRMLKIAVEHPISLIVNALGSPPRELVEEAHSRGIKIAALAGTVKHAIKHRDAGCDMIMAVGTEAGGHTGKISSMVLWPAVVDAVAPVPVLGGGGVGRGRQVAAALALGCEGVWCGSIWLKTVQSDVPPAVKERMFNATHEDTVHTASFTGKMGRLLRNSYTDAWDRPDAPEILPPPLQRYIWEVAARRRVERVRAAEFWGYPVGQIVGDMKEEISVREVVRGMIEELLDTKDKFEQLIR